MIAAVAIPFETKKTINEAPPVIKAAPAVTAIVPAIANAQPSLPPPVIRHISFADNVFIARHFSFAYSVQAFRLLPANKLSLKFCLAYQNKT